MPIYEYECVGCKRVEEAFQKISDAPLTTCSHCQGKLNKLISHSSFHLKGSGWYVTDYAGAKSSGSGSGESTPPSQSGVDCKTCEKSNPPVQKDE